MVAIEGHALAALAAQDKQKCHCAHEVGEVLAPSRGTHHTDIRFGERSLGSGFLLFTDHTVLVQTLADHVEHGTERDHHANTHTHRLAVHDLKRLEVKEVTRSKIQEEEGIDVLYTCIFL